MWSLFARACMSRSRSGRLIWYQTVAGGGSYFGAVFTHGAPPYMNQGNQNYWNCWHPPKNRWSRQTPDLLRTSVHVGNWLLGDLCFSFASAGCQNVTKGWLAMASLLCAITSLMGSQEMSKLLEEGQHRLSSAETHRHSSGPPGEVPNCSCSCFLSACIDSDTQDMLGFISGSPGLCVTAAATTAGAPAKYLQMRLRTTHNHPCWWTVGDPIHHPGGDRLVQHAEYTSLHLFVFVTNAEGRGYIRQAQKEFFSSSMPSQNCVINHNIGVGTVSSHHSRYISNQRPTSD